MVKHDHATEANSSENVPIVQDKKWANNIPKNWQNDVQDSEVYSDRVMSR
jgi:hypothetical protein